MLWEVLHAVEAASAPLDLNELSRRLNLDRGVLDGIIQFWVRKGRLVEDAASGGVACTGCGAHTCGSCSPDGSCPFTMKMPRTISLCRAPVDH